MSGFRERLARDPSFLGFLQALPAGVVLLDGEFRIAALNEAAEAVLGPEAQVIGDGPGAALHCVNALASGRRCGAGPVCEQCLLRATALAAQDGNTVSQREVVIAVRSGSAEEKRVLLVSAAPYVSAGEPLVIVLLQDVTPLHRLRGLIPICASCKKIRRDDQAWERLEAFIENHSYAEFTHGLCPECLHLLAAD